MPKKKKYKKQNNNLFKITGGVLGASLGLGVGASVLERLPATTVTPALSGSITRASGYLPTFATVGMGSILMKKVKKFGDVKF